MATDSSETRAGAAQELAFRKPRWMRVLFVVSGLISLGIPSLIWYGLVQGQTVSSGAWLSIVVLCVSLSIMAFVFSGPDDIYFDVEQKTYHCIKGWPPFSRVRSGHWKDFWGVYLGRTQGKTPHYCVGVSWWGGGGSMTLGRFHDYASAGRFTEELMSKLELQRVIPPRNLRSR